MRLIIGNTGLVGKTLSDKLKFDYYFNTININTFNDIANDGDELFLSCLPATKWLVNKNVSNDIHNILSIINIISKKKYSRIVLISTIDVYNNSPFVSNEDYNINVGSLNYGNNRYIFELLIKELVNTDDLKIFRLPALFNKYIKKNILFDLINNNNVNDINRDSSFQWYNLDNIVDDINYYSNKYPNEIIFNLFTEPLESIEIINLFPKLINKTSIKDRIVYNYTTKYNSTGYIKTKEEVLEEIKKFINENSSK